MLGKDNSYKLLKLFLMNPLEEFGLRELARLSKISPPSVLTYLKQFEEEGLIQKKQRKTLPIYTSCLDNEAFKNLQKLSILIELTNCKVIDYLWDSLNPEAIILYGSFAKGEAINESDIDLFIEGKEKKLDLTKFEASLGKKLHLIFGKEITKISPELKNNIVNGVILKGYLKVFK